MGGGLMQLVAYGAQDIYLTGNPQITFFKTIYRRHTNFAVEAIQQPFIGTIAFGNTVSSKIPRSGDLVTNIYLRAILNSVDPINSNFAWVKRVGVALINVVDVRVGGTIIDRQYGIWLDIWYELARQGDHDEGYAKMIGDVPALTNYNSNVKPTYILYVPLKFWFNKYVGLAIPLIALQYHDMYINMTFQTVNNLVIRDCSFDLNTVTFTDASLLVNYVYLDTDERRRFAVVGHEYLIEQIQFNGTLPANTDALFNILNFNHPVKELYWAIRNGNYISDLAFLYYTNSDIWSMTDASETIILKSISIGVNPEPITGGTWFEIFSGQSTTVGTFNIKNKNLNSVFANPTSVSIGTYGITSQINADIIVNADGTINISNVMTTLTVRDFSIPVDLMTDTRYNPCDPIINLFSNYGLLIDGSVNPVLTGVLLFNGNNRFDARDGNYFNYVQPYQHHENTPRDGINVYSFGLFPEQHQPSGTANFSRIDTSTLNLTVGDSTQKTGLPSINYFNGNNQLHIFGQNYNIWRVFSGLSGLAYVT